MKIIIELTGLEYRLVQEAIGALLDDAKKYEVKLTVKNILYVMMKLISKYIK